MRDLQENRKFLIPSEWQAIAVIAIHLALPAIWPGPLGWLQGLVPVPVCYYLVKLGQTKANSILINAILFAGIAALIFGSLPAFIFTCTMLPVGLIIGKSHLSEVSPPRAGLQAVGILVLLWIAFWTTYGSMTQTNPYQEMLTSMDASLTTVSSMYQSDTSLSLNDKEEIANTIKMLRDFMQQIAPGLLLMTAIITVWLNLLLGQWIINRKLPSQSTWPPYRLWRLPEQLIWVVIGGGFMAIIPAAGFSAIGKNILLAIGTLYFFQGIAVLAKLFAKWSIPRPMRVFLFAIAILQGAGFFALAVIGIADIWVNFGTPRPDSDPVE